MGKNSRKNASKTIAIVGLPNSGKSQVFHRLTGVYNLVANYPLTTIQEKRTVCEINGEWYEVIDTPGLHYLYIHSEEELAVRDLFFSEQPDILIQCIDCNRLKQSLILTTDLLELGIPLVVCLNAIDETSRNGTWLDSDKLQELLGVPVVETVAVDGLGIPDLKQAIRRAGVSPRAFRYGDIIETGIIELQAILNNDSPYHWKTGSLLLQKDPFMMKFVRERAAPEALTRLEERIQRIHREYGDSLVLGMANKRGRWIDEVATQIVRKQKLTLGSFAERFGHLSRHPVYGLPILAFFMVVTFFMVVRVAGLIESTLDRVIVAPCVATISGALAPGFWNELLVGHYGILTLGLFNALCTVLPILGTFYLVLSTLEDIGYLPNLCVLTRRIFDKFGLSGKSVLCLILAFGCKTMAALTTKGLSSFKERFIANYLIASSIPCAAQLALQLAILGRVGIGAFFIVCGVMALAFVIAGIGLNKIIKGEIHSEYIQMLPPTRVPRAKAVLVKTGYRLRWFLKEAVPIFLLAALALFLMDKGGLLEALKGFLKPVMVDGLGLHRDVVDVLILCIARHEAAAGLLLKTVDSGVLTSLQVIVTVVLITMFIPCLAHVLVIARQIGVKMTVLLVTCVSCSALVIAGLLNQVLQTVMGG